MKPDFLIKLVKNPISYIGVIAIGTIVLLKGFVDSPVEVAANSTPKVTEEPFRADVSAGEPSSKFSLSAAAEVPELPTPVELTNLPVEGSRSPAKRLRSFARNSNLQLIDSQSLLLSKAVIDLLELTPQQAQGINDSFRMFLERLRSNELIHAYVSVSANGNEEIVVSPFDRSALVMLLRNEISSKAGADVGAFFAEQLAFDGTLAVVNAEMRVAVETGSDGADRVTFKRKIQNPQAPDEKTPYTVGGVRFAATNTITTAGLLGSDIGPRLKHLFAAEKNLPRRAEIAP